MTSAATLCRHCGRPIGAGTTIWIGDAPCHPECTQPYVATELVANSEVSPSQIVDPTSKLAAAIDRLAAALEQYNSRNAPLPYPFPDERPIWPPK